MDFLVNCELVNDKEKIFFEGVEVCGGELPFLLQPLELIEFVD